MKPQTDKIRQASRKRQTTAHVEAEVRKKKKAEGIDARMANYLRAVVSADMDDSTEKQKDTLTEMLKDFGIIYY